MDLLLQYRHQASDVPQNQSFYKKNTASLYIRWILENCTLTFPGQKIEGFLCIQAFALQGLDQNQNPYWDNESTLL